MAIGTATVALVRPRSIAGDPGLHTPCWRRRPRRTFPRPGTESIVHFPTSSVDGFHGQLVMSWLVDVLDESAKPRKPCGQWILDTTTRLMTKPLREIVRLRGQSAKGLDGHAQSVDESRSFRIPPSRECLRPASLRQQEMSPSHSVCSFKPALPRFTWILQPAQNRHWWVRPCSPLHSAFGLGFRNLH